MSGNPTFKSGVLSRLRAAEKSEPQHGERPAKITEGVPLAKLIPRRLAITPEVVMLHSSRSIAAEKFRRLKTLLTNDEDSPQVIVVTSGAPGEGKSMISLNLALSFAAEKQGEVLLIDADLRRPTIEHFLSPPPQIGLAELLYGSTEPDHAVLELQNTPLRILPAGTPPPDPVELLSSDYAKALIADLRRKFARIIIDTPPIVPFTDADVAGSLSDGLLLVCRAGITRRSVFQRTIASVTSTRVLGTVLNEVNYNLADRQGYYADDYHKYYSRERKTAGSIADDDKQATKRKKR